MRRNIDGTCSPSCCSNPNIRTINTMNADTQGNFEIRAGTSVSITTETNGIRIDYTGGLITYTNTDGNIIIDNDLFTIDLADDITITGDMIIAGDLTVNGTYYTVHAEHVYTQDDYIILREGATTPLGSGSYAGFQVTKYDGTNDGRLVIDNSGTARVGDVGDEQPLLTREEAADLTDGDILTWDAMNSKAVGIPIDATPTDDSPNPVSSNGVYDAIAAVKNTQTSASASNVSAANSAYINIQTLNITEPGDYLFILSAGFDGYASAGGWFLRSHLGTHATLPFISGLLASGTASFVQTVTTPITAAVAIAQFSGGTLTCHGTITAIKLN